MTGSEKLLPDLDDPVSGPFWRAARQHRLLFQRCGTCSYVRWPPSRVCPSCLTPGGEWSEVDGTGTVWSFCVYEHAYHSSLRDALPYNVALVEIAAGPRMITNLVGLRNEQIAVGMTVIPVFEDLAEGVTLVKFQPADRREVA